MERKFNMYQSNGYKATKRVCNITKGILIQILNNQEKDPMSSKEEAKECYDDAISQCKYCMKEFLIAKLLEEENILRKIHLERILYITQMEHLNRKLLQKNTLLKK